MKSQLEMVRDFHTAFDVIVSDRPLKALPSGLKQLRINLITEEYKELMEAFADNDIVEIADALADLIYVLNGTAVSFGIPLDEVFKEVHESNMSKLDTNGRPIFREDGKVLKSSRFRPPDIAGILNV